jgi:hypothetical protein
MTLSMAWIRRVNTVEELVFASDSRLRAGYAWDCAPKILPLSRGDCAVSFAGPTEYAYPIMEQIRNAIWMHPKVATRATDLCDLKGHSLRVVRHMESFIHDLPRGKEKKDPPDTEFIFAGYSWAKGIFKIWILEYVTARNQFEYRRTPTLNKNPIAIIGDYVEDARKEILELLKSRGKEEAMGFDMEPFEVLRDFCRDDSRKLVGGAPQVLKVCKHMNAMPYAIYWPDKRSGQKSLMGRPLLQYEKPSFLFLDPDTLSIEEETRTDR